MLDIFYSLSNIVLAIIIAIDLILAVFVLVKSIKNNITAGLWAAIFIFCMALWSISNLIIVQPFISHTLALNVGKIVFSFACLIAYSFLIFCLSYLPKFKKNFLLFSILFIPVLLELYLINFTTYIIKDVEFFSWGTDPVYGKLYFIFVLYFIIYVLAGSILLLGRRKKVKGIERIRLNYVLLGFLLSIVLGSATNIIYPIITGYSHLSRFGPVNSLFLVVFMSYAITRYRFMDFKVVLRKSLIHGVIWGGVIFTITALILFLNNYVLNNSQVNLNNFVIVEVVLIIVLFPVLRKQILIFLNKYFDQEEIDLSKNIAEFNSTISYTTYLKDVVIKTIDFMEKRLTDIKVEFLVRDYSNPDLGYFYFSNTRKRLDLKWQDVFLNYFAKSDDNYISKHDSNEDVILKQELPYIETREQDKNLLKNINKFFKSEKVVVLAALKQSDGTVNGFIFVDAVDSDRFFNKKQVKFIHDVVVQVKSALAKVVFYEQSVARVRREFGGKKINN